MKTLIERLHFVSGTPWVYYELLGVPLADFPDDGRCVVMDVVNAIRREFGVGLPEAYAVWKAREIQGV